MAGHHRRSYGIEVVSGIILGLDTDDRCLRFHELGNTVKTASYWQVRQPLSDRASGRWRNYERHLGPLRQSLREAGIAIDDA